MSRAERLALERRLIEAAQAGDQDAMQSLIESVRPLIWKMINQNRSWLRNARGIDERDLEQNAYTYVIYAVGKFDTSRGLFFITYATHWINHGIQLLLRKSTRFGAKEVASVEDMFMGFDDDSFYDRLEDENAESPEEKAIQERDFSETILTSFITQLVREKLANFKSLREKPGIISDIVLLRWLSDDPVSLAEMGKQYGLSRTTMSTIERAMKREVGKVLR